MLDYTTLTRGFEGVVVFVVNSSRYVPERSGIYQIIPTPYCYSPAHGDAAYKSYFAGRRRSVLDLRRPMQSNVAPGDRALSIGIGQFDGTLAQELPDRRTMETMRLLCTFFPPFYVGQAQSLRDRFLQHAQGRNSTVNDELIGMNLTKNLVFFRWFEAPAAMLNQLERILIRATLPDLNTQSR